MDDPDVAHGRVEPDERVARRAARLMMIVVLSVGFGALFDPLLRADLLLHIT